MTLFAGARASDFLLSKGVSQLYHFTNIQNLKGIMDSGGLFSKDYLYSHGIRFSSGGNQQSIARDTAVGNNSCVCLAYNPYFPMMYHRKREFNLCLIVYPVSIVDTHTVFYTATNSTAHNANRNGLSVVDSIDFDKAKLVDPQSSLWKFHSQAEVIIEGGILNGNISEIRFVNSHSLDLASHLISPGINARVDPASFADSTRYPLPTFPAIEDIRITLDATTDPYIENRHINTNRYNFTSDHSEIYYHILHSRISNNNLSITLNSLDKRIVNRSVNPGLAKYIRGKIDQEDFRPGENVLYFWIDKALWGRIAINVV